MFNLKMKLVEQMSPSNAFRSVSQMLMNRKAKLKEQSSLLKVHSRTFLDENRFSQINEKCDNQQSKMIRISPLQDISSKTVNHREQETITIDKKHKTSQAAQSQQKQPQQVDATSLTTRDKEKIFDLTKLNSDISHQHSTRHTSVQRKQDKTSAKSKIMLANLFSQASINLKSSNIRDTLRHIQQKNNFKPEQTCHQLNFKTCPDKVAPTRNERNLSIENYILGLKLEQQHGKKQSQHKIQQINNNTCDKKANPMQMATPIQKQSSNSNNDWNLHDVSTLDSENGLDTDLFDSFYQSPLQKKKVSIPIMGNRNNRKQHLFEQERYSRVVLKNLEEQFCDKNISQLKAYIIQKILR